MTLFSAAGVPAILRSGIQIRVDGGTFLTKRNRVNLIASTGMTITGVDDAVTPETDITFSATGVGNHNILSATHSDSLAAAVVAGDLIRGNATPAWARLPIGTTDQVLTVVAGLPAWAAAAGGGDQSLPRFRLISTGTGSFHGPHLFGQRAGAETTTVTLAANTLYACAFMVAQSITVNMFYTFINTAAGAGKVARGVIYQDNGSMYPSTMIVETANFAVDTTGNKNITLTATVLTANTLYWIAITSDGAPQLLGARAYLPRGIGPGGNANSRLQVAQTFPTNGSPAFPAGATDEDVALWMGVRRSA